MARATMKVRDHANGTWVDVVPPSEVESGPTAPTDAAIKVWLDTSDPFGYVSVKAKTSSGAWVVTDPEYVSSPGVPPSAPTKLWYDEGAALLKAKDSTGVWQPTGGGGGGAGVAVEIGTYIPALTGVTIGTGGQEKNEANFTWVGGPNSADAGMLHVGGFIKLAIGGAVTANIEIPMPPGFKFRLSGGNGQYCGAVSCYYKEPGGTVTGAHYVAGQIIPPGSLANTKFAMRVNAFDAANSRVISSQVGVGVPFVWGQNCTINYNFAHAALRV